MEAPGAPGAGLGAAGSGKVPERPGPKMESCGGSGGVGSLGPRTGKRCIHPQEAAPGSCRPRGQSGAEEIRTKIRDTSTTSYCRTQGSSSPTLGHQTTKVGSSFTPGQSCKVDLPVSTSQRGTFQPKDQLRLSKAKQGSLATTQDHGHCTVMHSQSNPVLSISQTRRSLCGQQGL